MPAAFARDITPPTAPALVLTLAAIARCVHPSDNFCLRISLLLRMDSRSVATGSPRMPGVKDVQRRGAPASFGAEGEPLRRAEAARDHDAAIRVITMPIPVITMPIPVITMRRSA
jgi:hypothetical protein